MTLKCLSTGSTANCYILTHEGKHLILDMGIPVPEIKKGMDFDIGNVVGALCTHCHKDHSLSVEKLKKMGIPVWQPYLSEHKRQRTRIGDFQIECFDVPHNGTENRGFLITMGGTTFLYCTDYEYIPYDLSKRNINVMLLEMNYQKHRITDNSHLTHVVLGHAEEQTAIGVIQQNLKCLRAVILCHMSNSGGLDRELAMQHIREIVPEYISTNWAKAGESYDISECPF